MIQCFPKQTRTGGPCNAGLRCFVTAMPETPALLTSQGSAPKRELVVMPEEAGMKLLRFLERRLAGDVPKSMLHKWIRTGQVRVNKGRSAPHKPLEQGDAVRVPPFAVARECTVNPPCASPRQSAAGGGPGTNPAHNTPGSVAGPVPGLEGDLAPDFGAGLAAGIEADLGPDVPVVAAGPDYMILAKPGGLAVHPGTGIADSLVTRLEGTFAGRPYIPAPAHRLDRHTSGLILVGTSHKGQARLHECFASGTIHKRYLAWTIGRWPFAGPVLLADDHAHFQGAGGRKTMSAMHAGPSLCLDDTGGAEGSGQAQGLEACHGFSFHAGLEKQPALLLAVPVLHLGGEAVPAGLRAPRGATLLLISLLTGKKHQIRIQTALRRHPIIGDGRYGGPAFSCMLLHSYFLRLPEDEQPIVRLPEWPAPFAPEQAALALATKSLERAEERLPAL